MPSPRKSSGLARKPAASRASQADSVAFEKLLRQNTPGARYDLRLYITGTSPRSVLAIANVRALCEEILPGRYDLEVIDIYQQPAVAATEQIIAAPTLVKKLPLPLRRLIGDLSDRNKILIGLNLVGPAAKAPVGAKKKKPKT